VSCASVLGSTVAESNTISWGSLSIGGPLRLCNATTERFVRSVVVRQSSERRPVVVGYVVCEFFECVAESVEELCPRSVTRWKAEAAVPRCEAEERLLELRAVVDLARCDRSRWRCSMRAGSSDTVGVGNRRR